MEMFSKWLIQIIKSVKSMYFKLYTIYYIKTEFFNNSARRASAILINWQKCSK